MSTPRSASSIALAYLKRTSSSTTSPRSRAGNDRVHRLRHRRRRVEQLGDARDRDPRLLVRVEHLRQLLDRCEEQVEVEQERDELADVQRSVRDEHAAGTEHDRGRDVGEEVDEREVDRDEPLGADAGVAVAGRDFGEHLFVALLRARTPATRARPTGPLAGWRSPRRSARAPTRRPSTTATGTRSSR